MDRFALSDGYSSIPQGISTHKAPIGRGTRHACAKDSTIFIDIELQQEQQKPTDYELAQQAIWDDEQQEMLDDYD